MGKFAKILLFVSVICSVGTLVLYFYAIPIEVMLSGKQSGYIFDKLSLQMWFLEIILIIILLGVGALTIVGYQSVKEEAIRFAVEEAKKLTIAYLGTQRTDEGLNASPRPAEIAQRPSRNPESIS